MTDEPKLSMKERLASGEFHVFPTIEEIHGRRRADPTLTFATDADGNDFLLVVPAPSFQAQLDRIEGLLREAVPKKVEREAPDSSWIIGYLIKNEPGKHDWRTWFRGFVDIGDGTYVIKTETPVDPDNQAWIKAQFEEEIRFEVVP
jgi:hypothetical protein